MNLERIVPSIPFILQGIGVTLQIVIVSIILGVVIGTILALMKISRVKLLEWIATIYISIFRGTPLLLQLVTLYYAVPQLTGYKIEPFLAAVLAFGLNSAAYVSEIIRAGIQAIDKGQTEAAQALGIPYNRMMLNIILPQATKNILPALMNEFISLTKESAIVAVIGTVDIMRRADIVAAETYLYFEPYLVAGLIYYVLVMVLTMIGKAVERRMNRSDV